MNEEEFQRFLETASYKGERLEPKYEETHISWVAFSKSYVYKIKKAVRFTFLDFSTLALRNEYCHRELKLNQRFSSIYLDVLPILEEDGRWRLGGDKGEIRDYAVLMDRMDSSKRMDKMLQDNKVIPEAIYALAKEVASFHKKAELILKPFDLKSSQDLFADIGSVAGFVEEQLGRNYADIITESIRWSKDFLERQGEHIQWRIDRGYQRDLHGDLHAGNIFLYTQPVLFDCIEFNEEFRHIDLLYEIAFLCMELEADGHDELASGFLRKYNSLMPVIFDEEDVLLYRYYKCLRANVRGKVKAISMTEADDWSSTDLKVLEKYLSLMAKYIRSTGETDR